MKPYLAPVMNAAVRRLGIMVSPSDGEPPFADRRFLARLCRLGQQTGLPVFVFAPEWADVGAHMVTGYQLDADDRWRKRFLPYPDLIYDRSFPGGPEAARRHGEALRCMYGEAPIPLLGRGIGSKLKVAAVLKRYASLRPLLPETRVCTGMEPLLTWLSEHGEAVLKPVDGMHGKGVIRISQAAGGEFRIMGRSRSNGMLDCTLFGTNALEKAIRWLTAGRRYLLQPYLKLTTKEGDAFDIRSLVQKDENGHWSVTGMAVRRGPKGSLTSNIHGGGCALPLTPFLHEQFGAEEAAQIEEGLLRLSHMLPPLLERHFGRLTELGLDLGVDRDGRLWFIEANTKPGREAFTAGTAGSLAARLADIRPVLYARFLLGLHAPRLTGGVKPETARASGISRLTQAENV